MTQPRAESTRCLVYGDWSTETGWEVLVFIFTLGTVAFRRATDTCEKVWTPFCAIQCLKHSPQPTPDNNNPNLEALLARHMHSLG